MIPVKKYTQAGIGENSRQEDLLVNVVKTKKLTNIRAAGADEKASIAPAVKFSMEEALEYIGRDECVEFTPLNMRIRKLILNEHERKRASR